MTTKANRIPSAVWLALLLGMPVPACTDADDNFAERAGRKVDDAAEDVKDTAEDVGDKVEDAADKAEDELDKDR